ncbi:hypothetical protein VIGAN_10060700 [Vigna angularis var. angularis]|uniref:Uncharacterized protein n=1 Tax=Vigna angularis var. angularis TaxID=157739 RepID=A0A0S3T204_PHAAN|nr:hypothetical protein VIGAN_10060700 [Vigna angularis var. angularis]
MSSKYFGQNKLFPLCNSFSSSPSLVVQNPCSETLPLCSSKTSSSSPLQREHQTPRSNLPLLCPNFESLSPQITKMFVPRLP